jgi:hypothetical protein
VFQLKGGNGAGDLNTANYHLLCPIVFLKILANAPAYETTAVTKFTNAAAYCY